MTIFTRYVFEQLTNRAHDALTLAPIFIKAAEEIQTADAAQDQMVNSSRNKTNLSWKALNMMMKTTGTKTSTQTKMGRSWRTKLSLSGRDR